MESDGISPRIRTSVFNFCFVLYMVVSSVVVVLFSVFLFLDDDKDKGTIYSHIIVFLLGTWSSFMVVKGQKTHDKVLRHAVECERADRRQKERELSAVLQGAAGVRTVDV
jgi:hypothetical protein